ncbi:MAG: sensor histidine kinase, partial [Desulfitobacterium sp.]|nr:sensor histidine kinase [Desulfitobacterium sp.]
ANMQISIALEYLKIDIEDEKTENPRENLGAKVIIAQEKERMRVAREIHDGPAQDLANIVLRLEIAEKLLAIDTSKVQAEITDLKGLVRSNLRDIRRIIFDLRPIAFDGNGLLSSLEKYLISFEDNYKIKCDLLVKGEEKQLLPVIEVSIFRSLQECLTNIAKHSLSDWAGIEIEFQEDIISLVIKDRGIGFHLNKILENPGEHYGLIGVKERIEMLNGKIDIDSVLEKGTTIKFFIPIDQKEALG